MTASESPQGNQEQENTRPFVTPCRKLDVSAPIRWVQLGVQDFRRAPGLSVMYGAIMMAASWLITWWAWNVGSFTLVIMLFAGFVFIGPALALALYSVSCQLDRGLKPKVFYCARQGGKRFGNQMMFSFALLIVFLLWAKASTVMNIFLPMDAHPAAKDLIIFLGVGLVVGTLFSIIIFCIGSFSLPMMMDRDVDAITAMITSFHAVLENKKPMFVWAAIIFAAILSGFVTAYLAFLVTLPVIGYASWRGYKETIIADDWPQDPDTVS